MIDNMTATLKKEQQDDNDKKEYCEMQFDAADDKKKGLERSVSNLEKSIAKEKDASNCIWQYSFLSLSSCCSVFNVTTMVPIIFTTLAKFTFLPCSAKARKFNSGRPCPAAARTIANACWR